MLQPRSFGNKEVGEDAYIQHSNGGAGSISRILLFRGAYLKCMI